LAVPIAKVVELFQDIRPILTRQPRELDAIAGTVKSMTAAAKVPRLDAGHIDHVGMRV